jgi:hypothetical protein
MWYVEVLVKTAPRRKCPWGATKEIGLFTTPSGVRYYHPTRGYKYHGDISNNIISRDIPRFLVFSYRSSGVRY